MWLYPWLTYFAIAAMVVVILAMALVDEVRAQLWWSLGSLAVVLGASWWRYRRAGAGEWAGRSPASSARA